MMKNGGDIIQRSPDCERQTDNADRFKTGCRQQKILQGLHGALLQDLAEKQIGTGIGCQAKLRKNDQADIVLISLLDQLENLPAIPGTVGHFDHGCGSSHTDKSIKHRHPSSRCLSDTCIIVRFINLILAHQVSAWINFTGQTPAFYEHKPQLSAVRSTRL